MVQTESWSKLQARMREQGDKEGANKLVELADKLQAGKAAIALSGHFSAGKSSLINLLCGRRLLPTGPIPTSANLVVIEDGPEEAIVYTGGADGGAGQQTKVAIDELEEYCKNGEQYRRIDIRYPSELLANKLLFMDTPGVDSTDDAHMLATESSLHLADAVLYVTDYNHVLSETNLSFTKRLKDWEKPLYIIVNQVDKHQENELDYEQYKSNVIESFRTWGVVPEGFLFVSVKQPDHPNSEWESLIWVIEQLRNRAGELLAHSAARSAKVLLEEHAEFVFPSGDSDADSERQAAWALDEQELARVQREMDELERQGEQIRAEFRHDVSKLADNAQIMPAALRDLADHYLQSRKPGFKAGFLFTEARTKAEVAQRLERFYAPLAEAVDKQLVWHINQLIRQAAERYGEAGAQRAPITCGLTPEWAVEEVKPSASFTGEYTITYCRQLAERIKNDCKRKAMDAIEEVAAYAEQAAMKQAASRIALRDELRARLAERDARREQQSRKDAYLKELGDLLEPDTGADRMRWPDPGAAPGVERSHAVYAAEQAGKLAAAQGRADGPVILAGMQEEQAETDGAAAGFHYRDAMSAAADSLAQIADELEPLSAFEQLRASLLARAGKLRDNRFTVALFGAFSAGKSSFANALIGEPVLPVSPNPTTAAINSILPPTADHRHQTAHIHMKTSDALLSDIRYSLSMLGLPGDSIAAVEQAAGLMKQLNEAQVPAKGKPHLSFIHAALSGYADVRDRLGTVWTADFETYRQFVAEEHKSCFVDSIDLHYDTAFGDQGVVFVDTPGADSIHARHTGVTFNYIKNADAIVFVTYYNHAFSQADKQFLLQLGRVKDSFDLDKMFFIVNAADLAASQAELEQVLEYVESQLLAHGIRNPRLFAISSRMALEAKQRTDRQAAAASGIAGFERSFAGFARDELAAAMLQSAELEAKRTVGRLTQTLEAMEQGESARVQRAEQLGRAIQTLSQELRRRADEVAVEPVRMELAELLHHVKQRYTYRFGELYNDAFHPSVLREDGRDMAVALQAAWKQLQQSSAIDISQELLATTLRMEQYIHRKAAQWNEQAAALVLAELPDFIGDEWQLYKLDTPAIDETLGELPTDQRMIRRSFKNAKSFFEGEGKQALRRLLEADMTAAVGVYAERHEGRLSELYERLMREAIAAACDRLIEQLEQYVQQVYQHKEEKMDPSQVKNKIARIQAHMQRFARERSKS